MVKLADIINSQESLNKLLQTQLPVKIAYTISKIVNKMQPELKIYDELRVKLIKDLGTQTDKEKDSWSVKPENVEKFTEEIGKLTDVEINLSLFGGKELDKLKIEDLGDIKLAPQDLVLLTWLFE